MFAVKGLTGAFCRTLLARADTREVIRAAASKISNGSDE
jgi:hypothetical protein